MTSTLVPAFTLELAQQFLRLAKPYTMMFSNRKGGCGKSAMCVLCVENMVRQLLAVLPPELHHLVKVLVVDMDPQADITQRLAVHVGDDDETIVDILAHTPRGALDDVDPDLLGLAEAAIKQCGWDDPIAKHIWVVPGHEDIEKELEGNSGLPSSFTRLRNALHGWTAGFQFIAVDCPPALHHLAQLAMCAADAGVLITTAEKDSVRAIGGFFENMLGMRAELNNPGFEVVGVVASNVLENTNLHRRFLADLSENYGDDLWGAVPHRIGVAEAFSDRKPPLGSQTELRTELHLTQPLNNIVGNIARKAVAA